MPSHNDRPYYQLVALTEGRSVLAVASFNKEQAEAAIGILRQPQRHLIDCGSKILDICRAVNNETYISCSAVRPDSGLVVKQPVNLPRRAMFLIGLACVSKNQLGREYLCQDLERVAAGLAPPRQIIRPFLRAEGFKPKGNQR